MSFERSGQQGGVAPYTVDIDPFLTPATQTNWSTFDINSSDLKCGSCRTSGAQNAAIGWDVLLGAGTWELSMLYAKSTDAGIAAITLDGASLTSLGGSADSIDQYAGVLARNTVSTITGIVIPATAIKRLLITMATKNASSSSFFGRNQGVRLRRTA